MRAPASGIRLTRDDAAIAKGMLARGDRQHDIAAYFGVNGGRIGEIATGEEWGDVPPAPARDLPPPGPYPTGRDAMAALEAVEAARKALRVAETLVRRYARRG